MSLSFPHLSRRAALGAAWTTFVSATIPRIASAAPSRDPRLVVIVLRGALDGLSAAAPIGDPSYADLHKELALEWTGAHPAHRLDGIFGLHPAMKNFARLYDAKQALVVHAAATNYRDRSHFDGQDVLESGMSAPGFTESGWLNRAVAVLPKAQQASAEMALAVGYVAPLIMRGPAPILGWAPAGLTPPTEDFTNRLLSLYAHTDVQLERALREGVDAERMANRPGMDQVKAGGDSARQMKTAAVGAARLMAADDGPRIGALAMDGWDTHAGEGGATGRLALLLGGLDDAFAAFETELGEKWKDTVIVAITEFGRTAQINGTVGTDHGTGTAAFLAGGAVAGGRVLADWPGLRTTDLYEARDLRPTTDLRAVLKGVLNEHLGLSVDALARTIFPDTIGVAPMRGLISA